MEILSLGEKIKTRRKELNMTLKDLAGDRITPGQISLVESGKSNPSMDLLEYLAITLSTSIEYLMESEETQAEKICTYFENIAESYIITEDLNDGEKYIEKALYYAEKYSLEYRKAKNLYLRGIIYMTKGEKSLAQQFFLSANLIFIKNNNSEQVVNTFVKLGKITLDLKAYHSACSYFQQAEKVYNDNQIGNDFLLGEIYFNIAFIYFKLDKSEKAMNYCYLAQKNFSQLDNKKEYAKSLLMIAEEYSKRGDTDNAIKYSKKTVQVFKQVNDIEYIAKLENDLGKLFCDFNNIEESFVHLNKAKELRKSIKDSNIVETLINICENYIKLKKIDEAKEVLNEIIEVSQDGKDKLLVEYYLLKFRVDMLEGIPEKAEKTLLMALNFVTNLENYKEMGEISIMIGKYYLDTGRAKDASKYLNDGVEMFKKIGILKEY